MRRCISELNDFSIRHTNMVQIRSQTPGTKKYFYNIISLLKRYDSSKFFHQPVDRLVYPSYYLTIKSPMDFQTVRDKSSQGLYNSSIDAFFEDIFLICNNAKEFNPPENPYYKGAENLFRLSTRLKTVLKKEELLFSFEKSKVDTPSSGPEVSPEVSLGSSLCKFSFPLFQYYKEEEGFEQEMKMAVWDMLSRKLVARRNFRCDCSRKTPNTCPCKKFLKNCTTNCNCNEETCRIMPPQELVKKKSWEISKNSNFSSVENKGPLRVSFIRSAGVDVNGRKDFLSGLESIASKIEELKDLGESEKEELFYTLFSFQMDLFKESTEVKLEDLSIPEIQMKDFLFDYTISNKNFSPSVKDFKLLEEKIVSSTRKETTKKNLLLLLEKIKFDSSLSKIPIYEKGVSIVNKGRNYSMFEPVIFLDGEIQTPTLFFERRQAISLTNKHLQYLTSIPITFFFERSFEDVGGFDSLFVTFRADSRSSPDFIFRLISHSCHPNLGLVCYQVNGVYIPALVALREILPGEELTLDFRSSLDFFGGNRRKVCLCGAPTCGVILQNPQIFSSKYIEMYFCETPKPTVFVPNQLHECLTENDMVLKNTATLFRSMGKGLNNAEKLMIGKYGLRKSITEMSPVWLKKFTALIVNEMHEKELNIFEKSRKVQALAILFDFVKFFLFSKNQDFSKAPIGILTEEEKDQKLWNGEGSVLEEGLTILNRVETTLRENGEFEFAEGIKNIAESLKKIQRKEEYLEKIKIILDEREDLKNKLGAFKFNTLEAKFINLKLFAQIFFLWFSTKNFFILNKFTAVPQRVVDIKEILSADDIASLEKNNKIVIDDINKQLKRERKYSPYCLFFAAIYWEFPFIKKNSLTVIPVKVMPYVLPDIENSIIPKYMKNNIKLDKEGLHEMYQENAFEFNYKVRSVLGSPWLDSEINKNNLEFDTIKKNYDIFFSNL